MKRLALALLLLASPVYGRGMIVADISPAAQYSTSGLTINKEISTNQLETLTRILDRFGSDYVIVSPSVAKTEFCRRGKVTYNFGTAGAYADSVNWVIHLAFNGNKTTSFSSYRPESLTVYSSTSRPPSVPQLMFLEDSFINENSTFANGATDSTWVDASGELAAGGGSGNHEGEGTSFPGDGGTERWLETGFFPHYVKKSGSPNGGMRVLLSTGANSYFSTMYISGQMTQAPDSVGTANTDTMSVWEKLNLHASGDGYTAARIIFASFGQVAGPDSTSNLVAGVPNVTGQPNYPAILVALAHLDSLTGGDVFGSKRPGVGFVITHAGGRSDRRHPGGIFAADTSFLAASLDSLSALGARVVVAADPESLTANGDIALWGRLAGARFTPFYRKGIDTTVVATSTDATSIAPLDIFGRYRNRTFVGDSLLHFVAGSDKSIKAQLGYGRYALNTIYPGKLSKTLVAPDWDISPYHMRRGQNEHFVDSLWLAVKDARFSTIISSSLGRDSDPRYIAVPVGWQSREERVRVRLATDPSDKLTRLNVAVHPVAGSTRFFGAAATDSTAPLSSAPAPNVAVAHTSRFWDGFFGPSSATRGARWDCYDCAGTDENVYLDTKDRIYARNRGSVVALPAQWFGGGVMNIGTAYNATAQTYPTRPGFYVFKGIANVIKAVNRKAGRTVMTQGFPEDIDP